MSEETTTQNDAETEAASAPEDTRTDAQKKAAEILAARAKGKPQESGLAAKSTANPKPPKEKKEKAPAAPKGDIGYRFKRDIDPAIDKLNNQQTVLVNAMLELRKTDGELKDVVLRKELFEKVTSESLKSRQPAERVFGFYLNGWKKDVEATDKKPAIPALLEVVKIVAPAATAA